MGTRPLVLEVLSLCLRPLGMGDFSAFGFFVGWRPSFALFLVFDNSALTAVATFASNHRRWSIAGRIVSESFTDTLEPARLPP